MQINNSPRLMPLSNSTSSLGSIPSLNSISSSASSTPAPSPTSTTPSASTNFLLNNNFLLPTLSFQGTRGTESSTEEMSLSNQQIEGLGVKVGPSSTDSITQTERDLNTDHKIEELEQRTNSGGSYLSSIRKNVSGITAQLPRLEPKDWSLSLSVCVISMLYQIYTARALERKYEIEFEQMLNKLLKQTEQAMNSPMEKEDLIFAEMDSMKSQFNRIAEQLNQPGQQGLYLALGALMLSISGMFFLWGKVNSQGKQLNNQAKQLDEKSAKLNIQDGLIQNLKAGAELTTIEQEKHNMILHDITEALQQYQVFGTPEWIAPSDSGGQAYPYAKRARVCYRTTETEPWEIYESLSDQNTTKPSNAEKWMRIVSKIASQEQATAGTDNSTIMTPLRVAQATANKQPALGYTPVQQGTGIGQQSNAVKIGYSEQGRLQATVDDTDQGNFVFESQLADYARKDYVDTHTLTPEVADQRYLTSELGDSRYVRREERTFPELKSGYQVLPSGLILQWGTVGTPHGNDGRWVQFPIKFSNDSFNVFLTDRAGIGCHAGAAVPQPGNPTGFQAYGRSIEHHGISCTGFGWFAIGH
ncbi:hypothetical protein [Mycoavidus sp. SF9855]|uniref:gp53-like domain-containing protein n=1 Tax=Mycoavidus sp. SF9855 TaxID=2968475 RepID=UPI00211B9528|nr:hypothetical protein [Mycoavidus sp. SF9855]UUM21142.1 hypothetical protein NQD60_06725 [Mycoavidus sp. SF9855]